MLTLFDYGVLIILAVSSIFGLFRGFLHEVLGLLVWAIVLAASYYLSPLVLPYVPLIEEVWICHVIAFVAVFFALYIPLMYLVRHLHIRAFDDHTYLAVINQTLGFGLGIVRALVVCALLQWLLFFLVPTVANRPDWVKDAHFGPFVSETRASLIELYEFAKTIPTLSYSLYEEGLEGAQKRARTLQEQQDGGMPPASSSRSTSGSQYPQSSPGGYVHRSAPHHEYRSSKHISPRSSRHDTSRHASRHRHRRRHKHRYARKSTPQSTSKPQYEPQSYFPHQTHAVPDVLAATDSARKMGASSELPYEHNAYT